MIPKLARGGIIKTPTKPIRPEEDIFMIFMNQEEMIEKIEHQKKVIDRLSRKIQRLKQKRKNTKYDIFKNFLWECNEPFPKYHCTTIWTREEFEKHIKGIEKQIKGRSKYDNTTLVAYYLIKGQEFYVLEDEYSSYETGLETWDYTIAIALDDYTFFIMNDCGSN